MLVRCAGDGVVNFEGFGFGELVWPEAARRRDEEACRAFAGADVIELGSEDLRDGVRAAGCFGWDSSRCCSSNWSAARALVKDLRMRFPLALRQSAKYFWPFLNMWI
jgi:hypothetical protein